MAFKQLHKDENFNFQLNRLLSYGSLACKETELIQITSNLTDFDSWYNQFLIYAQIAEKEERFNHSMYYYRMAEFFLLDSDNRKNKMYYKMQDSFLLAYPEVKKVNVPFKHSFLPCIKINNSQSRGTILVHGGYDSFIEEFYLTCLELSSEGYNIVLFEGEGQGTTLRHGLNFNHMWENSVNAILDHFKIEQCAIMGISWGGYFATRAAAFDNRIKHVIAYDVLYDGLNVQFSLFKGASKTLIYLLYKLEAKGLINKLVKKGMEKSYIAQWALEHGMYITATKTPFDFYKNIEKHTLKKIAKNVTSNILLLAGECDHYIPLKQFNQMNRVLINANVKSRLFTKQEGGEQHCQVGNYSLALDEIKSWLNIFY